VIVNDHVAAGGAGEDGRYGMFAAAGNGLCIENDAVNIGPANEKDLVAGGGLYLVAHQQQRVIAKIFVHFDYGLLS
jgi:hypothetical protein